MEKLFARVLEELGVICDLVATFKCIIGKNNSDLTKDHEQMESRTKCSQYLCMCISEINDKTSYNMWEKKLNAGKVTQELMHNLSQLNRK